MNPESLARDVSGSCPMPTCAGGKYSHSDVRTNGPRSNSWSGWEVANPKSVLAGPTLEQCDDELDPRRAIPSSLPACEGDVAEDWSQSDPGIKDNGYAADKTVDDEMAVRLHGFGGENGTR